MKTEHEKLQPGDYAPALGRWARSLKAFLKAMEAPEHSYRVTKEDNVLARKLYEEVIALDPEYAFAYAGLAWTHMVDWWLGICVNPWRASSDWLLRLRRGPLHWMNQSPRPTPLAASFMRIQGNSTRGLRGATVRSRSEFVWDHLQLGPSFRLFRQVRGGDSVTSKGDASESFCTGRILQGLERGLPHGRPV